ncbi:MAG: DUF4199 domain-containing protein [Bacteroidetes bacterium]|nr:MAG: DUF4199 domain-containing protein [Bacteroidota bacterium]
MRKIVLMYGSIAGLLMVGMFLISFWMMENGTLSFENSELFGYTTMLVVMSLIFVGVRSHREKNLNGVMTFGAGFKTGILIAAVASLFYAGGWEVYYNTVPGVRETFMNRYIEMSEKKMTAEGKAKEEIDAKVEELRKMAVMYENPLFRFGITLMEIFPVGLLVTLISAGILRKRSTA